MDETSLRRESCELQVLRTAGKMYREIYIIDSCSHLILPPFPKIVPESWGLLIISIASPLKLQSQLRPSSFHVASTAEYLACRRYYVWQGYRTDSAGHDGLLLLKTRRNSLMLFLILLAFPRTALCHPRLRELCVETASNANGLGCRWPKYGIVIEQTLPVMISL